MRLLCFLVLIFGLPTFSFGQLNLSVLYSAGRTNPTVHQDIMDQFSADRPWLSKSFDEINWLNGYGLGIRYKIDRLAFNVQWENQINRIEAFGEDPNNNNEDFEQTLFFKLSTYSFGIESFFTEHLSLHGTIEFNNVRYRSELSDINEKFDIMNDWGTGSTFSIGYNFIGNGLMHVSLRPFVHLSWSKHDLTELNAELNPDTNLGNKLEEEFFNFGIKLIFYNGQW